jgi:hypothetical protein
MTEHRRSIRIVVDQARWPVSGFDLARAISTDRPDAQCTEAPAEPNQAAKTARSAPERTSIRATGAPQGITANPVPSGKSP